MCLQLLSQVFSAGGWTHHTLMHALPVLPPRYIPSPHHLPLNQTSSQDLGKFFLCWFLFIYLLPFWGLNPGLQTRRQMHCHETTPPGFCSYYICKLLKIRVLQYWLILLKAASYAFCFTLYCCREDEEKRGGRRGGAVSRSSQLVVVIS